MKNYTQIINESFDRKYLREENEKEILNELTGHELLNLLKEEFGPEFNSAGGICKEVSEKVVKYISNKFNNSDIESIKINNFFISKTPYFENVVELEDSVEQITTENHYVVKLNDKILDFTEQQYKIGEHEKYIPSSCPVIFNGVNTFYTHGIESEDDYKYLIMIPQD